MRIFFLWVRPIKLKGSVLKIDLSTQRAGTETRSNLCWNCTKTTVAKTKQPHTCVGKKCTPPGQICVFPRRPEKQSNTKLKKRKGPEPKHKQTQHSHQGIKRKYPRCLPLKQCKNEFKNLGKQGTMYWLQRTDRRSNCTNLMESLSETSQVNGGRETTTRLPT